MGWTPIHAVSYWGLTRPLSLLLKGGADVSIKDRVRRLSSPPPPLLIDDLQNGQLALDLAQISKSSSSVALLERYMVLHTPLEAVELTSTRPSIEESLGSVFVHRSIACSTQSLIGSGRTLIR
jgi:hypothetical protein